MRKLIIFIGIIFIYGCANTYKAMEPENVPFYIKGLSKGISYSYQADVLKIRGNKRYAKKEFKKNLKVIAVKITNNTDSVIDFRNDVLVLIGDMPVLPMETRVVKSQIRQPIWPYIFYLPLILTYQSPSQSMVLPIGIPIALVNMAVAGNANVDFKGEFAEYNLMDKKIAPNETVTGLICIESFGRHNIKLELKNNLANEEVYIEDETVTNNSEYIGLEALLLISDNDKSYYDYNLRVINYLENDMGVLSYEKHCEIYDNGNIKECGLKAKHKYGDNYEYNYKIGSWLYFDKAGNISEVMHHNLRGKKATNIQNVNWLNDLKGYDILNTNIDSTGMVKVVTIKDQYQGTESILFFSNDDNSFEDYMVRLISSLELDINVISYEKVVERYTKGGIVKRGLKVNHIYSEDTDEQYRIGTWEYYDAFGNLTRTIDFDIMGNVVNKKDY